jgi:anthranilate synthase component 2
MTAVTLIDNYDSFTWNLVHYLGSLGADVTVLRNDEASVAQIMDSRPEAIFGVCLGHQSIGEAFGGQVVRAPLPVHGKLASIGHEGKTIFAGIETPFQATRYHSLVIDRASMPDVLEAVAKSDDGLVMAVSHRSLPVHGVQFHPESILSQHGHRILGNFLDIARAFNRARVHA